MEQRLHELREQFYAALDRPGDRSGRWLEIWGPFANHSWYQEQLHHAAARMVRNSHLSRDWIDEIEQDAMLLLGQHLEHAIDLHVNRELAKDRFGHWLWTIIEHDCTTALRLYRAAQRRLKSMPKDYDIPDRRPSAESLMDIRAAVKQLIPRVRSVVTLYSRGLSVAEIATRLNISYWKSNRLLHAGLDSLSKAL